MYVAALQSVSAPSQVRIRVRARVAQALAIRVLAGMVFGHLARAASSARVARFRGDRQVFDDRFELGFRGLGFLGSLFDGYSSSTRPNVFKGIYKTVYLRGLRQGAPHLNGGPVATTRRIDRAAAMVRLLIASASCSAMARSVVAPAALISRTAGRISAAPFAAFAEFALRASAGGHD